MCDVSFPPEQKRCLYCSGRLGVPAIADVPGLVRESGSAPPPLDDVDVDEEEATTSPVRRGFNLIWILMVLGATLGRACVEG